MQHLKLKCRLLLTALMTINRRDGSRNHFKISFVTTVILTKHNLFIATGFETCRNTRDVHKKEMVYDPKEEEILEQQRLCIE